MIWQGHHVPQDHSAKTAGDSKDRTIVLIQGSHSCSYVASCLCQAFLPGFVGEASCPQACLLLDMPELNVLLQDCLLGQGIAQ